MVNIFQSDKEYISYGVLTDWDSIHTCQGRYILPGCRKYTEEQYLHSVACTIRFFICHKYSILSLFNKITTVCINNLIITSINIFINKEKVSSTFKYIIEDETTNF